MEGVNHMKRYRSMKIKKIIQSQVIETQEELAEALQKEGIAVTQATVSRDIKDLMLVKIPYKDGKYRYALSTDNQPVMSKTHKSILFQEAITKIDSTMNFVVIHTLPGSANSVAYIIDQGHEKEVLGTIAGDDTILVILRSPEDIEVFMKRIQQLLES